MFENILTKENVSFKELEQICFKIACEFAKEMLNNRYKFLFMHTLILILNSHWYIILM